MKCLNYNEKRIALIVTFVFSAISSIVSLVAGLISCLQLLIDFPYITAKGIGAIYMEEPYYEFLDLVQIFFIVSIAISILVTLSMFIFKKLKLITVVLTGINFGVFIAFAVILKINLSSVNYSGEFNIYFYELFSQYIATFISITIPLFIATLAKIGLEKQKPIEE
ncbi:MAG: hypothetical protein J1F32_03575 [Erysipelotrichales bacterium]|nr:hypothetical protein [Erysipelotrichales bacterium]